MFLSEQHERVSALEIDFINRHFQLINKVLEQLFSICLHAHMHCVLHANFLVILNLNKLAIFLLKNRLISLGYIEFLQFFVNFTVSFLMLLFALLFNLLFCKYFLSCLDSLSFCVD